MIAQMAQWAALFGGRRDDERRRQSRRGLVMMIVAPIAAMLVQMAISRSREYVADEGGATIAGNPRHLANALRKLDAAARTIPMHANPATAHMFIVSPLTGGGIMKLFSTHPPMEERIARLEACSQGANAMTQPDRTFDANWAILFLCWLLASGSTLGSVFFSHVMEFAPCVLCWYQRICLFPLVLILAAGAVPF